ncbi:hypothetical protein [Christiangramia sp. SM2212]|uniref:DoxX family protein n=1 Tax=Christiangramia sediminicola TaxID=3073267 RepID=A0ABU1ENF0_9FLAO|nr:hypothetical protein [Christiangramia sp. SM2212]MDR5589916.1 hypothetical protein [Christiangramia sp. SM2212]
MSNPISKKILQVLKYLAIYYLSIKMIAFAIPKLLHMQFRILHHEAFMPLAEISKYQHMWSFFGRSYNYNLFIGLMEILIGILVVFKRTRLIALLISLGVCINILILNIEFDIDFAIQHISLDLGLSLLLLLEYRKDLYQFFIRLGGKLNSASSPKGSKFSKILPFIYILVFPIVYFLYAQNLKNDVNDEVVGSYRIYNLKIENEKKLLDKGKLGSVPMIFFEYNGQSVLSVNDSLYKGSYFVRNDSLRMFFKTEGNTKNNLFKGKIISSEHIQGKLNDSLTVEMKIQRLSEEKDYLNGLY